MAIEIERRFFVNEKFKDLDLSAYGRGFYSQGYLASSHTAIVRVRVTANTGYITIKSHRETGKIGHLEFEYEIPRTDALALLELSTTTVITKTRYYIPNGFLLWEVDVFEGDNEGLIIAEIELPEENTEFDIPDWIGREVTGRNELSNFSLSKAPWKSRFE